ncbi:FeoB small GTPase domain-containing protein [Halothermothrix orenii]|uniref:Ferrous iron transport protein FeoB n=1 Tax=Halothermothrix orenii (strain H 168 / OCM 544 / DSM 9562) TaxID=373903 RepID=B8D2C1_HALOH|nr:FeoB small GTPase domain-containing protein [Halothermothrix orenii]ACL69348.1 Ferrous iron transport protein FeoB [Halothermothrix orenii H 168]
MNTKNSITTNDKKVYLVGSPNVGKSVIFNYLTDSYALVSNYPGTTVELSTGKILIEGQVVRLIDTPGIYSLYFPISEEEKVTRKVLMTGNPDLVIHVIDAKNIEKMLVMTFELLELGYNLILVLNIIDEAKKLGISINTELLSNILGIPVVGTVSITGQGMRELFFLISKMVI